MVVITSHAVTKWGDYYNVVEEAGRDPPWQRGSRQTPRETSHQDPSGYLYRMAVWVILAIIFIGIVSGSSDGVVEHMQLRLDNKPEIGRLIEKQTAESNAHAAMAICNLLPVRGIFTEMSKV